MDSTDIFILTDEWEDYNGKNILRFFGVSEEYGPVVVIINNNRPVFFIQRSTTDLKFHLPFYRKPVKMHSFAGEQVDALYFKTQRDLRRAAEIMQQESITTFEADIDPARRFLMEKGINAQMRVTGAVEQQRSLTAFINPVIQPCEVTPRFTTASIDIETGVKTNQLYSIAADVYGIKEEQRVFMAGAPVNNSGHVSFHNNEKELLENFFTWFNNIDPDIIIGWHVIGFDLMFLQEKCIEHNIPFNMARGDGRISLRIKKGRGNFASIPGRVVIDGPPALRSSFYSFEDFKLETVAQELLAEGKTISQDNKVEEIDRLFNEDKMKLAEYNLNDAVLVSGIFKKSGLVELSVKRSQLSGLLMERLGMMTAAFDHFLLPRIHKAGFVAPNVKDLNASEHSAGGYVIDPVPGLYEDVIVLDFKSLYPSIIRTFKIDPLSRIRSEINPVTTPAGYSFSSTEHFLPDFIAALMQQRTEANARKDKYLSQAIKILMNSFYGVMGSYGCRFYHPALPSAITGTGQWLLLGSKEFLEKDEYIVIYGDTDSLFVRLKPGEGENAAYHGKKIAATLNDYWRERLANDFKVESYLEIEYEKYYRNFVLTPARGAETGAKKRYVGLKVDDGTSAIEFVGMEFVRSDWTRLAKLFQEKLYMKIFNGEEIIGWIRGFVNDVKKGLYDDKLIYRKRLRKDLEEYTKNVPPQVKAARMLSESAGHVQYVITKRGPVPVELDYSDIDYEHYIDKQLRPVADSVLVLLGHSFDDITRTKQLDMFSD